LADAHARIVAGTCGRVKKCPVPTGFWECKPFIVEGVSGGVQEDISYKGYYS